MTDDRRQRPDRRILLPRPGGRRDTDQEPAHGTRARYQKGCRCCLCRAAEAQYRASLRGLHARGKLPLGATMSAVETHRLIAKLLIERFTRGQIARAIGLKRPILEFHTDVITVRNALKVRRLYRLRVLGEGPDQPHV